MAVGESQKGGPGFLGSSALCLYDNLHSFSAQTLGEDSGIVFHASVFIYKVAFSFLPSLKSWRFARLPTNSRWFFNWLYQQPHTRACSSSAIRKMAPQTTQSNDGQKDQTVAGETTFKGNSYNIVREGLADILNPKSTQAANGSTSKQSVFYNPIQQFNRDLSVLAIRVFGEDLAKIRRARHERRVQKLAKEGGKKGKREQKAENEDKAGVEGKGDAVGNGIEGQKGTETKRKRGEDTEPEEVDAFTGATAGQGEAGRERRRPERPEVHEVNGGPEVDISSQQQVEGKAKEEGTDHKEHSSGSKAEIELNSDHRKRKRKEEQNISEPGLVEDTDGLEQRHLTKRPRLSSEEQGNPSQQGRINESSHGRRERRDAVETGGPNEKATLKHGAQQRENGQSESQPEQDDRHPVQASHQNGPSTLTSPPFRILDALSATGLRALRYVKEIPNVTSVTANDLSSSAIKSIKLNAEYNRVEQKIQPNTADAKALMYHSATNASHLFDVIDLDPYGTAGPFLDAAVQAVPDGGMLCVTCTDSGVFASVGWSEKTFSLYGGLPWKGNQSHEAGLRLILHAVAASAARYGLAIEPLLSLSIDFYTRLFVRIGKSAAEVKFLASKTMMVYNCDQGCGSFSLQYLGQSRERVAKNGDKFYNHSLAQGPSTSQYCEHCGFKTHLGGPMWGGPLHNPHFITRILDLLPSLDKEVYATLPRIEGMLTLALNETLFQEPMDITPSNFDEAAIIPSLDPALRDPHPFFITPSVLGRTLHTSVPSEAAFRGALIHLGYRTTRSHTEPGSIRTDAPWPVIWEIMREWVRQKHPIKDGSLKKGTAGWEIMRKDRSRRKFNAEKQELRDEVDRAEDLETLRKGLEAALYRVERSIKGGVADEGGGGGEGGIEVVFDEKVGREAMGKKMLRYQMNPRADWGPMSKATAGM